MSRILKGMLNEANPNNYDSDIDYYDALNRKSRGRPEPDYSSEPEDPYADIYRKQDAAMAQYRKDVNVEYIDKEGSAPNGERYNSAFIVRSKKPEQGDNEIYKFNDAHWGAKKIVDTVKKKPDEQGEPYTTIVYYVDNHKHGYWKPWKDEPPISKGVEFTEELMHEGIGKDQLADILCHKIEMRYPDVYRLHDYDTVYNAVEDVANFHAGAEELGSSDISTMIREVLKNLENYAQDIDETKRKEAEYGSEWDEKVKRLGQMAAQGERKTVWDPVKRVYKTVPVNSPKEQGVAEGSDNPYGYEVGQTVKISNGAQGQVIDIFDDSIEVLLPGGRTVTVAFQDAEVLAESVNQKVKEHHFIYESIWDNIKNIFKAKPKYVRPTQQTGESNADFQRRVEDAYNEYKKAIGEPTEQPTHKPDSYGSNQMGHGSEDNELQMFISGQKPAAIISLAQLPKWKKLIDSGKYATAQLTYQGKPGNVIIAQPGEEHRVEKIQSLVQNATDAAEKGDFRPYQNSNYHRWLGKLLGYSEDKINSFIQNYFKDTPDLAKKPVHEGPEYIDNMMNKYAASIGQPIKPAPGVNDKGLTQQQWLKLVKTRFPDAKVMQAKMPDGPCQATLPDGRKLYWSKVEQGVKESQSSVLKGLSLYETAQAKTDDKLRAYYAQRKAEKQNKDQGTDDMRMHDIDEDWQKVNKKDKTDGMSNKAVKAYRRENPGSKLKTAVTTKPSKLKKGSKSAKRRKSFCARMSGMKKAHAGAKTKRDPDSPINKALRRWNCESVEQLQELMMIAEQKVKQLREAANPAQQAAIAISKKKEQGVAEGKKADRYHIVNKDGKPASLASYADRASAVKDRDAKHPGAVVQQVGPRGKVKDVAEEKQRLDPSCWDGYKKQGTKMKGDTRVNNCVPIKKESAIEKGLVDENLGTPYPGTYEQETAPIRRKAKQERVQSIAFEGKKNASR